MNFLKKMLVEVLQYLGLLVLCIITGIFSIVGGIYVFMEYGIKFLP